MSDYRKILTGPGIVLEQMLERRSKRAEEQQALLQEGGKALVSFCLNIPGDVKQFPLAKEAYLEGREALLALFPAETLRKETCCMEDTGNEGMFLLDADPVSIKRKTVELETYHPLGRLFDIDVLTPDGMWHECETWHEELKSEEHPWGTFVKDETFKTDFKKRFLDPYPHCRVTVVDYHC